MLPRVNQDDAGKIVALGKGADQRRHFHVVRPRADDTGERTSRWPHITHQRLTGVPGLFALSG